MSHFDRPHTFYGVAQISKTRTVSHEGAHPPGSYEAQMAVRRVFAILNPGKDFDETQARLKAERERKDSYVVDVPYQIKVPCKVCGALILKTNNHVNYCGPCSATVMQMGSTNRPGIAAMANKARKYQR